MSVTSSAGQSQDQGEALPPRRFVHVQTFGCQMNVNDTDRILQVLAPHGYAPTEDPARADLILLNTCSVRDKAEQKMLSQLGRLAPLKEFNDELVLGVAGCVAQQEGPRLLKKVPYLDLVFGPDHIGQLPELLERVRRDKRVAETTFKKRKAFRFVEAEPPGETKVSEFVTIMKGCDKVCSYCIVPFTRGREVSKPVDMILREIERLTAKGAREITLLGQNVNSYGKDLKGDRIPTFAQLLRRVDALEGVERLRFTTSHPMDLNDDLVACFGELPSLCEYFHLPVQSGSERILKEMRRAYTIDGYRAKVAALRAASPKIALSTDIIVGFPGETDEDFDETVALLREIRFDSIFAFKYSERPGTKAQRLGDTVPEALKKRRLAEVLTLQAEITRERMGSYIGQTLEVLIEGPSRMASRGLVQRWQMMGRTRTNIIVNFPVPLGEIWAQRQVGEVARVTISEAKSNSLFGSLA